MSTPVTRSLRNYDADSNGPFLGISDDGSAAEAIRDAAAHSPKAAALTDYDPFLVGIGHDAERLRSVGEVPVGPDQYRKILDTAEGHVLITTNVGSHVNLWHSLPPPGRDLDTHTTPETIIAWARENAHDFRVRDPQPWLRLRPHPDLTEDQRRDLVTAAASQAPVCIAVNAEQGVAQALRAIDTAAGAGAAAVVVDGVARPPTPGRPALPGILNYYETQDARDLLAAAHQRSVGIEPALKIDTGSVSNQIWTGLHAARSMGLHLGKYGLFPLTFQEISQVVKDVQRWMTDWTAAPVFYIDVPSLDGQLVYEPDEALEATSRWLTLVAEAGAQIVLIDTVDKARGKQLVKRDARDQHGIFTWQEIESIQAHAARLGLRALWAGGIQLPDVREFGRRRVFGIYVTTAASEYRPVQGQETQDIGLIQAKQPSAAKIALVRTLLDAGFLADEQLEADTDRAESGDDQAASRLNAALLEKWRTRLRSD